MHVENDLVEFVTVDDQEYEEIVEDYEEEIFMPEEFQQRFGRPLTPSASGHRRTSPSTTARPTWTIGWRTIASP
jgi:hypothetical protein